MERKACQQLPSWLPIPVYQWFPLNTYLYMPHNRGTPGLESWLAYNDRPKVGKPA